MGRREQAVPLTGQDWHRALLQGGDCKVNTVLVVFVWSEVMKKDNCFASTMYTFTFRNKSFDIMQLVLT